MKLLNKKTLALLLAAGCLLPAVAKDERDMSKAPKTYNLYLPGAKNKKDVKQDLLKQGFYPSDKDGHFSLIDTTNKVNKKKVLKLSTQDGLNDGVILPLTGNEKKVTVIFKALGSENPDTEKFNAEGVRSVSPYGMFYAALQNGSWQSVLRHNSSNQIKGSKGQSRLTSNGEKDGEKIIIVNDWQDIRFVYDLAEGPEKMTAKCYINGVLRHSDLCKDVKATDPLSFDTLSGNGHFLVFGENDGSTSGYTRYAYILVVIDEDVENVSLADLSKKVKADLVTNPEITDKAKGKKPEKKPANLTMTAADFGKDTFADPSAVEGDAISLDKLPYSKYKALKVTAGDAVGISKLKIAATVDKSGKNGTYKTITEALEAVPENSVILVQPGFYQEKIVVKKNGITLVGTDPTKTVIYAFEADTGGVDGNVAFEVNLRPATAPKGELADKPADNAYFNAANITFYNKGYEWNAAWGGSETRAVAFATRGVDKAYIKNCLFIGRLDTMYLRSGRVYMENCYIEGWQDTVCGGATVLFDNCHIFNQNAESGKAVINAAAAADTGYKSTMAYANGYVYRNCIVTAGKFYESTKEKVILGRGTWTGGSEMGENGVGKIVFMNSELDIPVTEKVWNDWDTKHFAKDAFFREYKNTGRGAASAGSVQMTDAEYNKNYSTTEKILGYTPKFN